MTWAITKRFSSARMSKRNNFTTGPDLQVGDRTRNGAATTSACHRAAGHPAYHRRNQAPYPRRRNGRDVALVEIGGTVGDIESLPVLEASAKWASRRARKTPAHPSHAAALLATAGS